MDADESQTAVTVDELLKLDREGRIDEVKRLIREGRVDRAGLGALFRRDRVRAERRRRNEWMKNRRPDMPAFTREDWRIALEFFDHRCAYCGSAGPLQRDHFIPLSPFFRQDGFHTADNIVPACRACNGRKGARIPRWGHEETEEFCGGFDGYQRIVDFLYKRFLALTRDPKAKCPIRQLRESMKGWDRKRRRTTAGRPPIPHDPTARRGRFFRIPGRRPTRTGSYQVEVISSPEGAAMMPRRQVSRDTRRIAPRPSRRRPADRRGTKFAPTVLDLEERALLDGAAAAQPALGFRSLLSEALFRRDGGSHRGSVIDSRLEVAGDGRWPPRLTLRHAGQPHDARTRPSRL